MSAYLVTITETIEYEVTVEAATVEQAEAMGEDKIVDSENRDQYFNNCSERSSYARRAK